MDLNDAPEEIAFRDHVRGWLAENLPEELRDRGLGYDHYSRDDLMRWHRILAKQGWIAPAWPQEWGGTGWNPVQRYIFEEECGYAGAPPLIPFGLAMCGPVLIHFGTPEQKSRFLPRIYNGDDFWCQGYSEPGSGSDLASLKTRAVLDGDHYVVTGQKTWTTLAHYADWIFCLVRTGAADEKKQEGISFLLIDMKSPGVEVRPIKLISGNSPFCETFFTDVKVPKENLMGPLNGGWTIGKRLLQFERQGIGGNVGGGGLNRGGETRSLDQVAKHYVGTDEKGRVADPDLRGRITNNLMDMRAFMLTVQRSMAEAKGNASPGFTTSIMKNAGSRIGQERAELLLEIMGAQALGWDGEGFTRDELDTTRGWLGGKATTIYGGSFEIQNNIISKRVLGLLDHQ